MSDDIVTLLLRAFGDPRDRELEEPVLMRSKRPRRRRRKGARVLQPTAKRAPRASAATIHAGDPQWRPEKAGWARFRGRGRRGHQPSSAIDDADLQLALTELANGREMLREAHELKRIDRVRGREAIKIALGRIALATRAADEVVARRGGVCGDIVGRVATKEGG